MAVAARSVSVLPVPFGGGGGGGGWRFWWHSSDHAKRYTHSIFGLGRGETLVSTAPCAWALYRHAGRKLVMSHLVILSYVPSFNWCRTWTCEATDCLIVSVCARVWSCLSPWLPGAIWCAIVFICPIFFYYFSMFLFFFVRFSVWAQIMTMQEHVKVRMPSAECISSSSTSSPSEAQQAKRNGKLTCYQIGLGVTWNGKILIDWWLARVDIKPKHLCLSCSYQPISSSKGAEKEKTTSRELGFAAR